MWHLLTIVSHDLTTGSWISRSFFTGLVVSSLFSLGLLGGFLTQTITVKLQTLNAPIASSGNASVNSTISPSGYMPRWSKTDTTSTIKKHASVPLNTEATDGKP